MKRVTWSFCTVVLYLFLLTRSFSSPIRTHFMFWNIHHHLHQFSSLLSLYRWSSILQPWNNVAKEPNSSEQNPPWGCERLELSFHFSTSLKKKKKKEWKFISCVFNYLFPFPQFQIEERHDIRHYLQVEVQPKVSESEAINPQSNYSKCFDDDGRLKRTGSYHQEPIFAKINPVDTHAWFVLKLLNFM